MLKRFTALFFVALAFGWLSLSGLPAQAQEAPAVTPAPAVPAATPAQPAAPAPPAAPPTGERLVALPSVAPVVQKASPAVVNIFTVKVVRSETNRLRRNPPRGFRGLPDEFMEEFFGFPVPPPREYKERALGSGFIFDPQGFIITNNHVVEGADDIKVKLDDGREISAEIIGRDPKTDLALIKLTTPGTYPFVRMGNSDLVTIGDWLVAIGNPFGLEHTVTAGILSARGRTIGVGPYDDFLQTDASINPGNSGGPLLNLYGEVVGINTIIIAGGNGIGFAIPSNVATKIIEQLKTSGRVDRGWIGVLIQEVTDDVAKGFGLQESQGALVGSVTDGSPAQQGGIRHGDIIVEFDGKPIKAFQELSSVVADTPIGKEANVVVIRDRKRVTLKLTVGRLEDDSQPGTGTSGTPGGIDLGLTLREVTPEIRARLNLGENAGLLVEGVAADSVAAEVGIQPQDVILEIDRTPVKTIADYNNLLRKHPKDTPLVMWVQRANQTIYYTLTLKN
ncbi:MAG: Do family serine endopeptidase [Deltaproteobacteria bacterium]|jgi:serine protease Do|nr:Do family serine endopeptidase [Deltaproteobacteria bacterium]